MKNIFDQTVTNEIVARINKLEPSTTRLWGKMTAAQMLAHCTVTYELIYNNIHTKPNALKKFVLKLFVKQAVVGEKPFTKNSPTSQAFKISNKKNFDAEKNRLINYIIKTQKLGEAEFDNKESHSFGVLTKDEWNNMFYKHLDHHLNQFGV